LKLAYKSIKKGLKIGQNQSKKVILW